MSVVVVLVLVLVDDEVVDELDVVVRLRVDGVRVVAATAARARWQAR